MTGSAPTRSGRPAPCRAAGPQREAGWATVGPGPARTRPDDRRGESRSAALRIDPKRAMMRSCLSPRMSNASCARSSKSSNRTRPSPNAGIGCLVGARSCSALGLVVGSRHHHRRPGGQLRRRLRRLRARARHGDPARVRTAPARTRAARPAADLGVAQRSAARRRRRRHPLTRPHRLGSVRADP